MTSTGGEGLSERRCDCVEEWGRGRGSAIQLGGVAFATRRSRRHAGVGHADREGAARVGGPSPRTRTRVLGLGLVCRSGCVGFGIEFTHEWMVRQHECESSRRRKR